jgi:hypothetical protein|tara:strand:+ start:1221 stop:1820 length:600 start_codon:yes stop_codon:yes gene_type:complete
MPGKRELPPSKIYDKYKGKSFVKKPMSFPDLSGDGKVTQKDILMGRGVIKRPKAFGKKEDSPMNFKKQDFDNAKAMDYNQGKLMDYHKPMMYNKPKSTDPNKEMQEVVVTGDASKIGAFGNQLDKAFESIENTISGGGFSSSKEQAQAGLSYGTNPSEELARLREMRKEKGAPSTLRYMRRRSRSVPEGTIPSFLSMPK